MASTACSEACLAVYLHAKSFSVSRALAVDVTVPPQKSVGFYSVRVGCPVAWKSRMDTNGLEWDERPRLVSFHSNCPNPVEIS